MMRRFYRNRHATFIKTLLEQKKKKEETADELRQKEEKRKQKIKEKAFAELQLQTDENGKIIRQERVHIQ